jgi:nitrite reductase/ring-hydroxylating ferredoxin subunit
MPAVPMARGAVRRRYRRDGAGSQGAFKPLAGVVKATTAARSLKTFPVEVRDGVIWLLG